MIRLPPAPGRLAIATPSVDGRSISIQRRGFAWDWGCVISLVELWSTTLWVWRTGCTFHGRLRQMVSRQLKSPRTFGSYVRVNYSGDVSATFDESSAFRSSCCLGRSAAWRPRLNTSQLKTVRTEMEGVRKPQRETRMLVDGLLWIDAKTSLTTGVAIRDPVRLQHGSPYLLAGGTGTAVADAQTTIKVAKAGKYPPLVRRKELASASRPGHFKCSLPANRPRNFRR